MEMAKSFALILKQTSITVIVLQIGLSLLTSEANCLRTGQVVESQAEYIEWNNEQRHVDINFSLSQFNANTKVQLIQFPWLQEPINPVHSRFIHSEGCITECYGTNSSDSSLLPVNQLLPVNVQPYTEIRLHIGEDLKQDRFYLVEEDGFLQCDSTAGLELEPIDLHVKYSSLRPTTAQGLIEKEDTNNLQKSSVIILDPSKLKPGKSYYVISLQNKKSEVSEARLSFLQTLLSNNSHFIKDTSTSHHPQLTSTTPQFISDPETDVRDNLKVDKIKAGDYNVSSMYQNGKTYNSSLAYNADKVPDSDRAYNSSTAYKGVMAYNEKRQEVDESLGDDREKSLERMRDNSGRSEEYLSSERTEQSNLVEKKEEIIRDMTSSISDKIGDKSDVKITTERLARDKINAARLLGVGGSGNDLDKLKFTTISSQEKENHSDRNLNQMISDTKASNDIKLNDSDKIKRNIKLEDSEINLKLSRAANIQQDTQSSRRRREVLNERSCIRGLRINITVLRLECGSQIQSPGSDNDDVTEERKAMGSKAVCHNPGERCVVHRYGDAYRCMRCSEASTSTTSAPADSPPVPRGLSERVQSVRGGLCPLCSPGNDSCNVTHHCDVTRSRDQALLTCDVTPCSSNPCTNGICVITGESYMCYCIPGYGGSRCGRKLYPLPPGPRPCTPGQCRNGGSCHPTPTPLPGILDETPGFRCVCPPGFTGPDCSVKHDFCSSRPCPHVCVDYEYYYECECNPGFTGDDCEMNIDECSSSPCHNSAPCIDHVNGYQCQCLPGFHGPHCELHALELSPYDPLAPRVSGGEERRAWHRPVHSLAAVALTLSGAIFIALAVIITCYCRVHGVCESLMSARKGYQKHLNEMKTSCSIAGYVKGGVTRLIRFGGRARGGIPYTSPIDIVTESSGPPAGSSRGGPALEFREMSQDPFLHNYSNSEPY